MDDGMRDLVLAGTTGTSSTSTSAPTGSRVCATEKNSASQPTPAVTRSIFIHHHVPVVKNI
jgi:hypothetical protein